MVHLVLTQCVELALLAPCLAASQTLLVYVLNIDDVKYFRN